MEQTKQIHISDEILIEELKQRILGYKKALEELKKLNDKLVSVNKALNESEKSRSNIISNIANQLVDPLTSITTWHEILLKENIENPTFKKLSPLILGELYYLNFQVKNTVTAALIEDGNYIISYKKINLTEIFNKTIEKNKFLLTKKNITLDLQCKFADCSQNYWFVSDEESLYMIISNILNNAAKYSKKDTTLEVCTYIENSSLVIRIKDYGEGIPEDFKNKVYDRFAKADKSISSGRGMGLGLSIVKFLVDLLNGEIKIDSQKGQYTEFTVIIPEATDTLQDDELFEHEEIL